MPDPAFKPYRQNQMRLFKQAYNQACDSRNKKGLRHYRDLIMRHCNVKKEVVDSLPDVKKNPFVHAQGPRQADVAQVEKWLGVVNAKNQEAMGKKSESPKNVKKKK